MSPSEPPPPPPTPKPPLRRPPAPPMLPAVWVWLFIILGVMVVSYFTFSRDETPRLKYNQFRSQVIVERDESAKPPKYKSNIKTLLIGETRLVGEFRDKPADTPENKELLEKLKDRPDLKFIVTSSRPFADDDQLIADLNKAGVIYEFERESGSWLGPFMIYMVPTLLLIAFFVFFLLPRMRDPLGGGFLNNYIKSPAKRYEKTKSRTTFEDVADMQNAKLELREVVDFLRSPEKFLKLGGQVPKGVLLIGPPGTGKTLLARAVAGEAGVPFFSISGSEFIQMFVGVGASRVRDMFKTAREHSPCILFIDEIDAVGRVRGAGLGGGHDEREQTLNQILSEMDGFLPTETVIVLAATNRPDVLDPALLRPGRFDRHVTIDRPTWQGRMEILKVHTRNKPLSDDVNLETIARAMIGMTGADLRNLANEAALIATREGKNKIERSDFEMAADRVLIGPKREEVLTGEDKRKTAYHEAGHALVTWLEPGADRPLKVSIIPRGQALGVNINIPEEERYHHGRQFFKARLVMIMGGRAADRLVYGEPYAGAEDDLKKATRFALGMVAHWGMSDRLGPVAYRIGEEHVFLGKEIQQARDFSEGTAQLIDEEVRRILQEADQRAYELLKTHRPELDLIVEALLQREELAQDEISQLLKTGRIEDKPATDGQPSPASTPSPSAQAVAVS